MLAQPDETNVRRTDRNNCSVCEGSASGCRSVEWLAGRYCCSACTGDHDAEGMR